MFLILLKFIGGHKSKFVGTLLSQTDKDMLKMQRLVFNVTPSSSLVIFSLKVNTFISDYFTIHKTIFKASNLREQRSWEVIIVKQSE